MIVWCEKCKDYTLDNAKRICSWCDTKLSSKRLAEADARVQTNEKREDYQ